MKYFFSAKSIQNLCNAYDDLKVYLIDGSCPFVKSKIISDLATRAAVEGFCTEKFLSPVDYDEMLCVYIKRKNCIICDSQYYNQKSNVTRFNSDSLLELETFKSELFKLELEKNSFLSSAAKQKNSAAVLQKENRKLIAPYINKSKILNYILRFVYRNGFCRASDASCENTRQLSSITAWGIHCLYETVLESCSKIFTLCGKYKCINTVLLSGLSELFRSYGYNTISFKCSLTDETEHLCIPDLSLAFLSDNDYHSLPYGHSGEIHTQRFLLSQPPQRVCFQTVLNNERIDEHISKAIFSMFDAMEIENSVSKLLTDEQTQAKLKHFSLMITNEIFANN